MDKEIKSLVNTLTKQGWSVEQGGSGHYKAKNPEGSTMVTMPATPSDPRSVANTIADLKRAGARIERGGKGVVVEKVKPRGNKGLRKGSVEIPWMAPIRKAKNLSQKELAQKIGMSQGGLNQSENAGRMKEVNAKKIAEALGVTLDELTDKVTPKMFADRFVAEKPVVTEGPPESEKPLVDYSTGNLSETHRIVGKLAADALSETQSSSADHNVVYHELGPETLKRVDRVLDIFAAIVGRSGDKPWQG